MTQNSKPNSPRLIAGIFYSLVAITGAVQVFVPENEGIYWLASVAIALAPTIWMIRDAKARGAGIPHIVQPLILAFWIIVIPAYLVYTRKLKGLGWALLHLVGTLVVTMLSYYLAIYCYWGPSAFSQPI